MRKPPMVHFEITGKAGIAGGIGPSWDGAAGRVTFYVEAADVREALSDVED